MARVVLIEASPWDSAGNVVAVYLAGGGSRGYNHRGRTTWKAGVVKDPKFSAAIGFDQSGWTGGAIPQSAKVSWFPSDKATLTSVAGRQWIGAPVTILVGDDAVANPVWTTSLTGTVKEIRIANGAIDFTIADLGAKLADPFLGVARFAGTGGIEGDAEVEGRIKRRSFGKVFNVEGRVLRKATNVFEFGDPAFPINAFVAVRDMARIAAPAPAVLAWQGSIAATLAALEASTPAAGSCVVAPSINCVKWWTLPSGPLTADLQGEIGAGYVSTPIAIAQRIVTAVAGLAWTAPGAGVNALRAATDEGGIHVGDESETTANVLDRLLLGAGILWVFDPAGSVVVREFGGNSVETLTIVDRIERVEAYRPVTARRGAYQRAYRKHNDGEISAAVKTADIEGLGGLALKDSVAFNDGTIKSSGGATATDTAYLTSLGQASSIQGQGSGATANNLTGLNPGEGAKLGGIAAGATVGADINLNIGDSYGGGYVTVPRNEIKTSLGQAASIQGQGPLATKPQADWTVDISGRPLGQLFTANLLNLSIWKPGTDLNVNGSAFVANYSFSPTNGTSMVESGTGPTGDQEPVLVIYGNGQGYGTGAFFSITTADHGFDPKKAYRFTAYFKPGGVWFVGPGNNVRDFAGNAVANPFHWQSSFPGGGLTAGKWYLLVLHFYGSTAPAALGISGIYDPTTGKKVTSAELEFRSDPAAASMGVRFLQAFYAPPAGVEIMRIARPTWQEVATAPSVSAVLGTPGADINLNVVDGGANGATVPRNEIRTPLGQAASIIGQSAFATAASVALGSPLLTGFGSLAGRSTARLGTEVYRADGTTVATESALVTALGQSLSIVGQGWYATASAVDFEDNVRVTNKGRVGKLGLDGRATDPRILNTQAILGPRSTTSLAPSYTVGASNVTVNLPAHVRSITGPSGKIDLSIGAVSGVVAFSTYWAAYIDLPDLVSVASPTAVFTSNPDDLVGNPNRYQISSGIAPASNNTGGTYTGGGGAQTLPRPGGGVYP